MASGRLVKVAVAEVIQEAVEAKPRKVTMRSVYLGKYHKPFETRKLAPYFNGVNYYFASPPRDWFKDQKIQYGGKPPEGMTFDEYGNGTEIYWEAPTQAPA